MIRCADCGFAASLDYVGLADECPRCHTTPFNEAREDQSS